MSIENGGFSPDTGESLAAIQEVNIVQECNDGCPAIAGVNPNEITRVCQYFTERETRADGIGFNAILRHCTNPAFLAAGIVSTGYMVELNKSVKK